MYLIRLSPEGLKIISDKQMGFYEESITNRSQYTLL